MRCLWVSTPRDDSRSIGCEAARYDDGPRTHSIAGRVASGAAASGLSLSAVAAQTGMSKGDLSRLETGKEVNPTLGTLRTYERALGQRLIGSMADLDKGRAGNGESR